MGSKGQRFQKWSFEEKLRIVKRHLEDHVSTRQSKRHKSWGYHRLAAVIRQETGWLFSDNLVHKCCKSAGIRSKARIYYYRKVGAQNIRFPNLVKGNWNARHPLLI